MKDFHDYWKALTYAFFEYEPKRRKIKEIPYVVHPINIAHNEFNLSEYIFSVKGEDLLGSKIIADVFEAIAGAIYFDSNRNYKPVQEKIVDKFYEKYKPNFFE